jgi:hypothetical protein
MDWIYYLCGSLVLLAAIAAVLSFALHHKYAAALFKRQAWKKLYRLAQDQDYYLLNNVTIKTESDTLHIDHLLVGDKYVYVIATRYFEDNIQGQSYVVSKWHVEDKNGTVLREVSNPVSYNEKRTMMLAKFLGWNSTKTPMFVSVVVINNSSDVKIADDRITSLSFLVHKKDVSKLIKKIERETNLQPFDDQSLMKIIARIHRLSEENKANEEFAKKKPGEKEGNN